MRVVLQRVTKASITINGNEKRSINKGLCIFLGIENADDIDDISWLIRKILNLRIFDDQQGVMNDSICDVKGEILIISQFTLHASVKKGNRPSYIHAAKPNVAIPLYTNFVDKMIEQCSLKIETGEFGADMLVEIHNDGPITIMMDSKRKE